ncbi:MAG TPA: hypothetical protein VME01_11435 [Solirubrobacteraceae bacterium]|nr:hypothetical protein [Solirubrobacteraceae bacterium]
MTLLIASTGATIARVVYSSVLASVTVSVVFALAVLGFSRATEMRRAGRQAAAGAYTLMATCSLGVCAVAVIYGLILVGRKS